VRTRSRIGELDEHAGRGAGMEEGDTFSLGAEPGGVVDESDAGSPAAGKRLIQVVDGEADVVDAGASLGDELANRALGRLGLEELDEII
jgi:hypothetical protein